MKILIVHPEGNINNNPNLFELAEVLCESGYEVDVLSQSYEHIYQKSFSSFRIFLLRNFSFLLTISRSIRIDHRLMCWLLKWVVRGYVLVVGVDSNGIVVGNIISKAARVPLAFVSYEIFFKDEVDWKVKREEIAACKNIRFALCQDELRAQKLSEENQIHREKIICAPVAGRKVATGKGNGNYLRERFGISRDKNIALYMGSLVDWAGMGKLMNDIRHWPENWVLVMHGRYRGHEKYNEKYKRFERLCEEFPNRLFLSKVPFENFKELYRLPLSADIGIAMYYPEWNSPHSGNNLKYLGWASGKVSTYMQCGLPVIINEVGFISSDVRKYDLGYVLSENERISDVLIRIESFQLLLKKENCLKFFSQKLDFDLYKDRILSAVAESHQDSRNIGSAILIPVITRILNLYAFLSMMKNRVKNCF